MDDGPTTAGVPRAGAPSVVLVDDHELVLDGLRRALERDGWTVSGAFTDPEHALRHLAGTEVDVVVVDLRLGRSSGLTVVEAVRTLGVSASVAVLTSYADSSAASEALRAGARGFLLKDTGSTELVARLRAVAAGDVVVDGRVAQALGPPGEPVLTAQEVAIVGAVARGLTNRQIGAELYLSHFTVKEYLARVMRKLGTRRRAETVVRAVELGLLRDYGSPSTREMS
ncbi:response regulator transcription factor [Actinomycetospora sp. TBRC 11914]|uniref:response regulator transcription factor n=1 Tax=Actinomycetospora sp. TBRC 11914 TaxID=2729387 RepID=UPI00145FC1DC|nr:response regulator transcription factor [Actinomycetospora sp. TBRC 11914]NMO92262.1 response regulator transcription factor [Actinomycetospora sp. TBRC 11914]